MMFQITELRLIEAEQRWNRTVNRFRGPIPRGMGFAQIVAESNNTLDPVVQNATRSTGLAGIPLRDGQRLGYTETQMKEGETSLYLWSVIFNKNGLQLHTFYPSLWATPTYDFWLSVRLLFTLGLATYQALLTAVQQTGAAKGTTNITSDIQNWITTVMPPTQVVGSYSQRSLLQLSDQLNSFRKAMERFDGPDRASVSFGSSPSPTPGGNRRTNQVVRI